MSKASHAVERLRDLCSSFVACMREHEARLADPLGGLSQVPSGELLEPRLLLSAVPLFSQQDPAWANDPMMDQSGATAGTIRDLGCAMTCSSMLAKYYGMDTDPKRLNAWLSTHQGYAAGGAIYWAKAADYTGGKMAYCQNLAWTSQGPSYSDNDHWSDLKGQLDLGYPVLVKVDAYPATSVLDEHWVLVTGFSGGTITTPSNYAINDPANGTAATLARYYDARYDNTFFAIRVYHGTVPVLDTIPPTVTVFDPQPRSITVGSQVTISYEVSDAGGSHLKRIELWRALDAWGAPGIWQKIGSPTDLSGDGPVRDTFCDEPPLTGTWWYGVHVIDNEQDKTGDFSTEQNYGLGPLPVTVSAPDTTPPTVTLTAPNSGTFLVGSQVILRATGSDANGISHCAYYLYKGDSALVGTICESTPGDGMVTSYTWTIPESINGCTINGTDYRIVVAAWDASSNGNGNTAGSIGYLSLLETTPGTIDEFDVTPRAMPAGDSFTIPFKVSDSGGAHLMQAELWRAPDVGGSPGTWAEVGPRRDLSAYVDGPAQGDFSDGSLLSPGVYWYGVHLLDGNGNYCDDSTAPYWNATQRADLIGPVQVTVTPASITDQEKQEAILAMVNTHRGILPAELVLAVIFQEGGQGVFHVDGSVNSPSYYHASDGPWAQPYNNSDGIMQVTSTSGYHELEGAYTNTQAGYDHAIKDGSDYLNVQLDGYETLWEAALHYNSGGGTLYTYKQTSPVQWGEPEYLSHLASDLQDLVQPMFGLSNADLVNTLQIAQQIVHQYLNNPSILANQSVSYYSSWQAQLDNELHNIGVADTAAPTVAISDPGNNATVTAADLTVTGTASDSGRGNSGISSVTVNGVNAAGGTVTGSNTANWSASIPLNPGANTITVVAQDTFGNSAQQQITVTCILPCGDSNGDGAVGVADLVVLQGHFGQSGCNWDEGDSNGDGEIDFLDYLLLKANMGKSVPAAIAVRSAPLAPATAPSAQPPALPPVSVVSRRPAALGWSGPLATAATPAWLCPQELLPAVVPSPLLCLDVLGLADRL